jgi:hypothetical protein
VYDDMNRAPGFARFAPTRPARGKLFSARSRAGLTETIPPPVVPETELYAGTESATPAGADPD